jgi:thiamine-monophosphate kinase
VLLGIGDDASVVGGSGVSVTSVDAMVEGTHFRLDAGFSEPAEIGHRALAGALSDLAAMGARPGQAYFVLGLPHGFSEQRALELMRGAATLAHETDTVIAGGDVVVAPVLMVSVTAVGWAASAGQLVTRSGARAGDLVGVTGTLGAAAAALAQMEGRAPRTPAGAPALSRAAAPRPRLREGLTLAELGAHAMIDLSDGLAADAAQLGTRSGLQLELRLDDLPLAEGVAKVAKALDTESWRLAAGGGEDYELCFCADPSDRERVEEALSGDDVAGVSWIGTVREGPPGVVLLDRDGSPVQLEGYEHRW